MKKFVKCILCIMGSSIVLAAVLWLFFFYKINYKKEICDISISPDRKYELTLQAIGEAEWPFGSASGRMILNAGKNKISLSQIDFELLNDGASISSSCWKVTWYDEYVEVILLGKEQFDEKVLLFFNGEKEVRQLTDAEDDYVTSDKLDESRVIKNQTFNVELNIWGEVQFVSYLPGKDINMEDVSFLLTKDGQVVYSFPSYCKNNTTENYIGRFDSVEAVGFYDIDYDNAKDVIVIINYATGAGPQGMLPRRTVRIFRAYDSGFIILEDLMNCVMANIKESELSVPTICEYIEKHERE